MPTPCALLDWGVNDRARVLLELDVPEASDGMIVPSGPARGRAAPGRLSNVYSRTRARGRCPAAAGRATFGRVPRDTGFTAADAQDDFQRARRRHVMSRLARWLGRHPGDVDVILPFGE